jgi:hypothetical protein
MGRATSTDHDKSESLKFRLAQVRLNNGGYDDGGAYWGHGAPLFVLECETDDADGYRLTRLFMRAPSRAQLKLDVLEHWFKNARFYR